MKREPMTYAARDAMIRPPSDALPLHVLENVLEFRPDDTPALRRMREAIHQVHGQRRLPFEARGRG